MKLAAAFLITSSAGIVLHDRIHVSFGSIGIHLYMATRPRRPGEKGIEYD